MSERAIQSCRRPDGDDAPASVAKEPRGVQFARFEAGDRNEPGALTPSPATLNELVAAAALAPSRGNEQPWKWVTEGSRLAALLDRRFGETLLDFDETARLLAIGAATENVVLRAHQLGLRVKIAAPHDDLAGAVVRLRFFAATAATDGLEPEISEQEELAAQIARRHTNRAVAPSAAVPPGALAALDAAVASLPGCRLQIIEDAGRLAELADIAARAETLRMVNPFGQRDLVREIRWTPEEARRTRDGIDLDTLDLAPAARADMQMLRAPGAHPLRRQRGTRALETRTRDAIMAAPAIGLVFAATDDVPGRLAAGRAIQRAWLTAAKLGLAIQPHTSSLYLFARASGGDDAPFGAQERAELGQLKARFDAVVVHRPLPVFMFRVFSGNKPPVRSLRRPVASFLLG